MVIWITTEDINSHLSSVRNDLENDRSIRSRTTKNRQAQTNSIIVQSDTNTWAITIVRQYDRTQNEWHTNQQLQRRRDVSQNGRWPTTKTEIILLWRGSICFHSRLHFVNAQPIYSPQNLPRVKYEKFYFSAKFTIGSLISNILRLQDILWKSGKTWSLKDASKLQNSKSAKEIYLVPQSVHFTLTIPHCTSSWVSRIKDRI